MAGFFNCRDNRIEYGHRFWDNRHPFPGDIRGPGIPSGYNSADNQKVEGQE